METQIPEWLWKITNTVCNDVEKKERERDESLQ